MNDSSNSGSSTAHNGSKPDKAEELGTDVILSAEKDDGSYSEAEELVLYSYDGGFQILDGNLIPIGEWEKLKQSDEADVVKFSKQDLADVLSQLLNDSPGGIF